MQYAIIWSPKAEQEYFATLDYWNKKTQSTDYSLKIIAEVEKNEKMLAKFPYANQVCYKKNNKDIRRSLILQNFSVFYQIVNKKNIHIVLFWDNRNNPKKIKF